MTELDLLRVLLLLSIAIASVGTRRLFFGETCPLRDALHAGAFAMAAVGLFSPWPLLCVGWLLFTAVSFAELARERLASPSPAGLAPCVPLLFANVAAVWLVGGANDLGILGYGPPFSFYAALHGNVLGWTVLGAMASLAEREGPGRRLHLVAVLVGFVSFLLVALGIDQLRALKPVGVVGLTLAVPVSQLAFLRAVWPRSRAAFVFGAVSFVGLGFTMFLAWRHQLGLPVFPAAWPVRGMVAVHGVLNAVVVAPSFLLAAALAGRTPRRTTNPPGS